MVGPVCEAHPYYPVCFVPVGVLVKDTPFQIQHSLISNFLFPTHWFCGRKVVFEIELPDMKPVSSFSILYLPMLSTNSLPHCNSYKSAWGGICQHCCSGAVYLNSHSLSLELLLKTVSCFPRIEAVINETWQFIVYFSVTCCSFFSALMNSALSIFTSSEAVLKEIPYMRTSLKVLAMNTDVKVIYFSVLACLLS